MSSRSACALKMGKIFVIVFIVAISSFGLLSCIDTSPQFEMVGRWDYSFPPGLDTVPDVHYDPEGGLIDAITVNTAEIDGKIYLVLSFDSLSSPGENNSRLFIFDTEDPFSPQMVSSIAHASQEREWSLVRSTAIYKNILYASLFGDKGIWMVDISDPANPVDLGISPVEVTNNLVIDGNYAYASGQMYDGVTIVDVSDIQDIREIARIDLPTREHCLAVDHERLYIGIKQTMTIFDISNPASPKTIGTYELEVPEGLVTELPFYTGEIHWGNWASIIDMHASGNYVYVTFGAGQVRVIDVSDPLFPKEVAEIDLSGFGIALTLEDDYLYITKSDVESQRLQLVIVDISEPSNPKVIDSLATESIFGFGGSSYAYCWARPQVIGKYIYVAGINYMDVIEFK